MYKKKKFPKNIFKKVKNHQKINLNFKLKTIIVACTNLENSNPIDMQLRYNVYNS